MTCVAKLTLSHDTDATMNPSRHIELDIDIGADARDWSAIQAQEKLKPVETELRRIEELVNEIVGEMDYLRTREQKLRDTNESTNERVKWFAFGTMGMLVGLGAWQVVYLRAYFRFVRSLLPHTQQTCHEGLGLHPPQCVSLTRILWQVQASHLSLTITVSSWAIYIYIHTPPSIQPLFAIKNHENRIILYLGDPPNLPDVPSQSYFLPSISSNPLSSPPPYSLCFS